MTSSKGKEGILDAVIFESKKQAAVILAMRTALEDGDYDEALEQAIILAGLKRPRSTLELVRSPKLSPKLQKAHGGGNHQ